MEREEKKRKEESEEEKKRCLGKVENARRLHDDSAAHTPHSIERAQNRSFSTTMKGRERRREREKESKRERAK